MMKRKIGLRHLCCLLCLMLLGTVLVPAVATAQTVEELFTRNSPSRAALDAAGIDWIHNIFFLDGVWYLHTGDQAVYAYTSDAGLTKYCQLPPRPEALDHDPVVVENINMDELHNMVNWLVAGEEGLYGYNYRSGKFGRVDESGIHWSDVKVDFSPLMYHEGEFFPKAINFNVLTADRLFIDVTDLGSGGMDDQVETLYGFDLTTGQAMAYGENLGITNMCLGKDGTMLYTRTGSERPISLVQFDPATGKETTIPLDKSIFTDAMMLGGLAYRSEEDTICFCYKGTLYQRNGDGDFQAVATLPTNDATAGVRGWLLPDGRYAYEGNCGVLICTISGQ